MLRAVLPRRLSSRAAARGGCRRGFFFGRAKARLLDIEGLERPQDFPQLAQQAIRTARQELDAVKRSNPLGLVTALDNASNELCRIADAAELCRSVHPDQKFVASANDAVQAIASFMGEVNLDAGVYRAMQDAESSDAFRDMPLEARVVLEHMRKSMEHEGIHLPDAEKATCLQLLECEQQLSFDIVQRQERLRSTGAVDANSGAWLPGASVRDALGQEARGLPTRGAAAGEEILVAPDTVRAEYILKTAHCSKTRQMMYEAQQASGEGEGDLVGLLLVRQQLANLRGYATWNDYAQREALFQSPKHVDQFLHGAWEQLRPGVLADLELLAAEKQSLGLGGPTLQPWDVPMLLYRYHQKSSNNRVSEYLSYGSLMKGVDLILSKLLGLAFVAEKPGHGEVWHPSVQKFTLRDGDKVLGILYLDPFARPGKVVQSAQFTLQGSKALRGGAQQVPATTLVFALPVGTVGLPLSYAVTFMHEIGHALHSLLSATTFQHLSGTRGTIDFVEFPSHLFEQFVLDPDCLGTYASHVATGAPMPPEIQRSCFSENKRFAYLEAVQQLMYAVVDQAFYAHVPMACPAPLQDGGAPMTPVPAPGSVGTMKRHLDEVLSQYDRDVEGPFDCRFTQLFGLSRLSKFEHLVHYGGSYYCYLFNRTLASHVWQHGFKADPFGAEPGERLRGFLRGGSVVQDIDTIRALCPGGGSFNAEDVPLDAFIAQLRGGTAM